MGVAKCGGWGWRLPSVGVAVQKGRSIMGVGVAVFGFGTDRFWVRDRAGWVGMDILG